MTSSEFAAAQQRVLARRQEREAQLTASAEAQHARLANSPISRVPFANTLTQRGFAAWDSIRGRGGTRPSYRIGQVDAELLDDELLALLKGQVAEGLKYLSPHLAQDRSSEILLALRAVLFKLSIWDNDASYGAALQGLKYTDARRSSSELKSPSRWQKACYGLITVGGRYGWDKWEEWLINQESGYEQHSQYFRLFSRFSSLASTAHDIAALVSFLVFLINGRYRTLTDRMLSMRLVPPNNQISREVSFEYLNRQLVWHAFTEFLLFLLPLVGISRWRRWLARAWTKTRNMITINDKDEEEPQGEFAFLPERTCAICYQEQNPSSTTEGQVVAMTNTAGGVVGSAQTDITNPYEAIPCACIYCFVCLAKSLHAEEGEGFSCLRCAELVQECKPWSGDVIEELARTNGGKSVTFADEEGNTVVRTIDDTHDSGYETAEIYSEKEANG